MKTNVTIEEVTQQFERTILLLLQWVEQRELSREFSNLRVQEDTVKRSRLLRVDEVADILAISKSHAYQLIRRGEFKCVRLGKSVRVRMDDLNSFIVMT